MVYRGQVCGDVIVLQEGIHLPDGSQVLVEPIGPKASVAPALGIQMRNGVPVFTPSGNASTSTLDLVNELRDDAP